MEMITIPIAWLAPYIPKILLWLVLCGILAGILNEPTISSGAYDPDEGADSMNTTSVIWAKGCIIMFVLMFTNLIVFV
jgi:hypothetical protein